MSDLECFSLRCRLGTTCTCESRSFFKRQQDEVNVSLLSRTSKVILGLHNFVKQIEHLRYLISTSSSTHIPHKHPFAPQQTYWTNLPNSSSVFESTLFSFKLVQPYIDPFSACFVIPKLNTLEAVFQRSDTVCPVDHTLAILLYYILTRAVQCNKGYPPAPRPPQIIPMIRNIECVFDMGKQHIGAHSSFDMQSSAYVYYRY